MYGIGGHDSKALILRLIFQAEHEMNSAFASNHIIGNQLRFTLASFLLYNFTQTHEFSKGTNVFQTRFSWVPNFLCKLTCERLTVVRNLVFMKILWGKHFVSFENSWVCVKLCKSKLTNVNLSWLASNHIIGNEWLQFYTRNLLLFITLHVQFEWNFCEAQPFHGQY